ncbi:hypothetical protein T492DRAFT_468292 [Pavlovales sp. CCMP2436]|nr:hypothetical protein T492DRAFT_468292 [Pavlovales sp. CCMP2436]
MTDASSRGRPHPSLPCRRSAHCWTAGRYHYRCACRMQQSATGRSRSTGRCWGTLGGSCPRPSWWSRAARSRVCPLRRSDGECWTASSPWVIFPASRSSVRCLPPSSTHPSLAHRVPLRSATCSTAQGRTPSWPGSVARSLRLRCTSAERAQTARAKIPPPGGIIYLDDALGQGSRSDEATHASIGKSSEVLAWVKAEVSA